MDEIYELNLFALYENYEKALRRWLFYLNKKYKKYYKKFSET